MPELQRLRHSTALRLAIAAALMSITAPCFAEVTESQLAERDAENKRVTAELMAIANSSVESAVADVEADESCSILEADDAQVMLAVFEGIRPFGRQWYLLYSDAIARSLRDEALRAELAEQRERMRNQIGALLTTRLEASGERALLPVEDLAQLLMGIFIDLLVREQLEGRDVTQLAATTILGTLRAFIAPKSD